MANPRNPRKPLGQPTRGKTAPNRLRRVDTWLMMYDPGLLRRTDGDFARAWYVDLGYGAEAFTTLESAARLRRLNPQLPVLGVEIDPERVANALPYAGQLTQFRLGGFNLPLQPGESVRAIRAFNVLRQYDESQVADANLTLMRQVLPGGLLIEGTSDPFGRVWVANLLRKKSAGDEFTVEGLLFSTNFQNGFEPAMFQPVLPKNFIHRMLPGEKIFDFIEAWKQAARQNIALRTLGVRQWFAASALTLHSLGYLLDLRQKFLRRGYLLWKCG
jgi:hypothetical protein